MDCPHTRVTVVVMICPGATVIMQTGTEVECQWVMGELTPSVLGLRRQFTW